MRVRGHTFVTTSFLISCHLLSLPSAREVRTIDAIKQPIAITPLAIIPIILPEVKDADASVLILSRFGLLFTEKRARTNDLRKEVYFSWTRKRKRKRRKKTHLSSER